jgi:hypothetical protein
MIDDNGRIGQIDGTEWLARALICDGVIVQRPLAHDHLTDADLRGICLRMHAILDTIEMPRCEGRLIPYNLFNDIDTLESMLLHGHPSPYGHTFPPRLAEWSAAIREFGRYYLLDEIGPIVVDPEIYRELATRYGVI